MSPDMTIFHPMLIIIGKFARFVISTFKLVYEMPYRYLESKVLRKYSSSIFSRSPIDNV